jgi:O-antigen/teichoic acid export membrane protein
MVKPMDAVRGGIEVFVRRLRSPATIYFLANALSRGGFVLLIPLYSRRLNQSEYGDFTLVQSLLSLAPVLSGATTLAASRFYFDSSDPTTSRRRVGAVAIGSFIIGSAVALALEGAACFLTGPAGLVNTSHWSRTLLTAVVVALLGGAVGGIPAQFYRDSQRPISAAIYQLLEFALVATFGVLFVAVWRRGLAGAVEALSLAYASLGLVSLIFTFRVLRGRWQWPVLREALGFSLPFVPHLAASWLQAVADRWVLKFAGSAAELGPYGIASQLSLPATMVVQAWNMERAARTGELFRSGGLLAIEPHMARIRTTYLKAWAVPALMTILAIPVLRLAVGRNFASAMSYLPALVAVGLVDALWNPHQHVLYYAGESRIIALITIAGAIATIALSWVLIRVLGPWGAVLGRAAGSIAKTAGIWVGAQFCFRSAGELAAKKSYQA